MQMYYATSFYSCCSPLKTSSFFSFYSYYSGSILRVSGFPSSLAIWLSCIPFTVNFLCTFIGIYAVEKAGRRVLTLLSFIGRFLRVIQVFMLVSQNLPYVLHFVGWFSCYYVPNTPFECYADSSVTPLHTTNNFHSEKKTVYSLRKIILAITYLTNESNFFHTGISYMFVL